jgi:hypothetical protein
MLLEDYDEDEELEEELGELELELDEEAYDGDEIVAVAYEIVEYDKEAEGTGQVLRELVSASGGTMVEALLELEIAYRNLTGIQ